MESVNILRIRFENIKQYKDGVLDINFCATDTRRLAMNSLENMSNEEVQLIIPKKAIFEIQKLFLDNAKISYDNTNLVISNEIQLSLQNL